MMEELWRRQSRHSMQMEPNSSEETANPIRYQDQANGEGDGQISQREASMETRGQTRELKQKIDRYRAIFGEQEPAWLNRWTTAGRNKEGVPWWSPAGCWCISARFFLLATCVAEASVLVFRITVKASLMKTFFLDLPALLSGLTSLYGAYAFPVPWRPSPPAVATMYESTSLGLGVLKGADIDNAGRWAMAFMSFWLVVGIGSSVSYQVVVGPCGSTCLKDIALNTLASCGTTPILSAVFFTLQIEITQAHRHMSVLTKVGKMHRSRP